MMIFGLMIINLDYCFHLINIEIEKFFRNYAKVYSNYHITLLK
jgi:hypothetical protein